MTFLRIVIPLQSENRLFRIMLCPTSSIRIERSVSAPHGRDQYPSAGWQGGSFVQGAVANAPTRGAGMQEGVLRAGPAYASPMVY
jgi:hypothetical protein